MAHVYISDIEVPNLTVVTTASNSGKLDVRRWWSRKSNLIILTPVTSIPKKEKRCDIIYIVRKLWFHRQSGKYRLEDPFYVLSITVAKIMHSILDFQRSEVWEYNISLREKFSSCSLEWLFDHSKWTSFQGSNLCVSIVANYHRNQLKQLIDGTLPLPCDIPYRSICLMNDLRASR